MPTHSTPWTSPQSRTAVLGAVLLACALSSSAAWATFPDSQKPPPGWTGTRFKLSQAYPATLPTSAADTAKPWLAFDFHPNAQPREYMQAVLDYCLEGNIDEASPQKSFADIATNPVRTWYHVPWLHDGREFIHGLTMERGSPPKILGPLQTQPHTNWAVGFYNPLGGYAIGQVWKNETAPDPTKAVFPEGTVSCKLLFSSAPLAEVPFLGGTFTWQANILPQTNLNARPTVRLLQLDIAVKDSRAPVTGWVFGTFQYEKAASSSTKWWKHMVPVGLMWGNDLANIKAHLPAATQWINTTRGQQFHLGFRGLLNGPIDNPQASCVACHSFAQLATPGVANPLPKLPKNNTWSANMSNANIDMFFQSIAAATALSSSYQSVDYSLQLQIGVSKFRTRHAAPASADAVPQIMSR